MIPKFKVEYLSDIINNGISVGLAKFANYKILIPCSVTKQSGSQWPA